MDNKTFIDIFAVDDKETKITIPIIQRDYAQGRTNNTAIEKIRADFLDALYTAVTEKPIHLDFIYGELKNEVFTPLDGQQRLTTLFLLHWYAAKRESIPQVEWQFLNNFSYETRPSSRIFCEELVKFTPTFPTKRTEKLSEEIEDQYWFSLSWKKDPTINSMLTMLDAIDEKFKGVHDLFEKLKSGAITFSFLKIEDMGLTDDIYIKMNSRGKPLTAYENFKAELEKRLNDLDRTISERIIEKMDGAWTNLLWRYHHDDDTDIGPYFLNFITFITNIILFDRGSAPDGREMDEFEILDEYFSKNSLAVSKNLSKMETYFDCWAKLTTKPSDFLANFISTTHDPEKIMLFSQDGDIDLFKKCISSNDFDWSDTVILYTFTEYLLNRETIKEVDFRRRLRIINNLVLNSKDELRASSDSDKNNRMPEILIQTKHILLTGTILNDKKALIRNFNVNQLNEEEKKIAWLEKNPADRNILYKLEDHELLKGQISIIGTEDLALTDRFYSLFQCDLNLIDCALMTESFYGENETGRSSWRYHVGTKSSVGTWDNIFHKKSYERFEKTSESLIGLLKKHESFSNGILIDVIDEYKENCEKASTFPLEYYYVTYESFRPDKYGIICIEDLEKKPYDCTILQTPRNISQSSYVPFLKEADASHLSEIDHGTKLIIGTTTIENANDCYLIYKGTDQTPEKLTIAQNDEGVDIENRIEKLKKYIEDNLN